MRYEDYVRMVNAEGWCPAALWKVKDDETCPVCGSPPGECQGERSPEIAEFEARDEREFFDLMRRSDQR